MTMLCEWGISIQAATDYFAAEFKAEAVWLGAAGAPIYLYEPLRWILRRTPHTSHITGSNTGIGGQVAADTPMEEVFPTIYSVPFFNEQCFLDYTTGVVGAHIPDGERAEKIRLLSLRSLYVPSFSGDAYFSEERGIVWAAEPHMDFFLSFIERAMDDLQLQQVKAAVHDYALRMGHFHSGGGAFPFRRQPITSRLSLRLKPCGWVLGAAGARLELEPADNKTGFSCVYRKGSKYQAKVGVIGFNVCLGTFVTPQEAALEVARHKAKEEAEAAAGAGSGI